MFREPYTEELESPGRFLGKVFMMENKKLSARDGYPKATWAEADGDCSQGV